LQPLHPRAVLSAAIVPRPEALQSAGSVRDTAEKQNVRILGDDVVGIGIHAAVVELYPLLPVVRSAVRVIVTAAVTGREWSMDKLEWQQHNTHPPV